MAANPSAWPESPQRPLGNDVGSEIDYKWKVSEWRTRLLQFLRYPLFLEGYGSRQLTADPDDPVAGSHVIWQSDGTDAGADGDIMMKITDSGGTTKTATIVDYSTV